MPNVRAALCSAFQPFAGRTEPPEGESDRGQIGRGGGGKEADKEIAMSLRENKAQIGRG